MDQKDRDRRDAAGIGPYAREREGLTAMSTLKSWTLSPGEPDIRGWEVRTVSGRQLGAVSDLLIDRDAGEVVLLDIDLPGTDRHTYAPIRVVQIDRAKRLVLMDSADLPESDLVRGERAITVGDDTVVRTARYPVRDRELLLPAESVDGETAAEANAMPVDRRQVQRRASDQLRSEA